MSAFASQHCGFRIIGLRSERLELRCAPDLGGRVYSLVNRLTGREWLWRQSASPELFEPSDKNRFETGTFAGLDECFPSVGACRWTDGRAIADHGDIWSVPWEVGSHGENLLVLTARIPAFGIYFRRQISLLPDGVRFDYKIENFSDRLSPALWSMHPLFALAAGDRLEMPLNTTDLLVESSQLAFASQAGATGEKHSTRPKVVFPEISPGVRLDQLELIDPKQGFIKCFTAAQKPGAFAALYNEKTGDRLEVHWDVETIPYLGLWLTRGGYRGWHHVALEPTNAPFDRVDQAFSDRTLRSANSLMPNETRTWWVEWRIG